MFEKLPYTSKIEICKLFYCDKFKCIFSVPKNIYFSWKYIEFESNYGDTRIKKDEVKNWYNNNLKIVRKEKLISIRKRETTVS